MNANASGNIYHSLPSHTEHLPLTILPSHTETSKRPKDFATLLCPLKRASHACRVSIKTMQNWTKLCKVLKLKNDVSSWE